MAAKQVQTVTSAADRAKVGLSALLIVAAVAGFYLLRGRGELAQWAVLLVGLVLALLSYLVSESGRRLLAFSRDSWREAAKVVWPARKETIQTTAFVIAFTVAMALVLWLADKVVGFVLYNFILNWK